VGLDAYIGGTDIKAVLYLLESGNELTVPGIIGLIWQIIISAVI